MNRETFLVRRALGCRKGARALLAALMLASIAGCDYFVSVDQHLERARAATAKGDMPLAVTELRKALDRSPKDPKALAAYARALVRTGDLDGAQRELDKAVPAGAPRASVLETQCLIWLARGRPDEALAALKDDQALAPAARAALTATALMDARRLADAEQAVAAGLQATPGDTELTLRRAQLLALQRRFDAALGAADEALRADPQMAGAMLLRGEVLLRQGAYAEAIAALSSARRIGFARLDMREYRTLLENLANAQLAMHDAKSAADTLQEYERRAPNSPGTHFLAGRLAMINSDYTKAVNEFQQTVDAVPSFTAARLMLGTAFLYGRDFRHAETELTGLLSKDPSNLEARKLLAQTEIALHRPEEARKLLAEVPNGAADSQVDWLMGVALMEGGRGGEGLEFLEQSVAVEPKGQDRRLALAQAYIAAGQTDKAIALLDGLEAAARGPQAQALLVVATVKGKEPAVAREALARLVGRHAQEDGVLAGAGAYMRLHGDAALAEDYLNRSLAINAKNEFAMMELARLRIGQGRLDDAQTRLKSILQVDAKYLPAYVTLASLLARRDDAAAARTVLEQAVAADPAAVTARLGLAQLALGAGDVARAQSLIDQALGVAKNKAPVLNAAGEVFLHGGQLDQALARFNDAIAAGSKEATLGAARAQIALGRNEEARHGLMALAGDPALKPRAERLLLDIDLRERDLEGARRLIAKLRGEGLAKPVADEFEGNVDMLDAKFADAEKMFASALAQTPTSLLVVKVFEARRAAGAPDPQEVLRHWLEKAPKDRLVRVTLAVYLGQTGARKDAVAIYEAIAHEDAKPDPLVLNNLAWLYIQTGDARAVATARQAYDLAQANGQIADTYGWSLVSAGKAADGLPILGKAYELSPRDNGIRFHLATAYADTGDKKKAADLLAAMLKGPDKFPERADAEALLRKVQ